MASPCCCCCCYRYVFCYIDTNSDVINRAMPSPKSNLQELSKDFFRRQGLPPKTTRSWRRLIANTPLQIELVQGRFGGIPGLVSILQRYGAWTMSDMNRSTLYEIYVSASTDFMGQDVLMPCSGRQNASERRVAVRLAALLSMTSRKVADPGEWV